MYFAALRSVFFDMSCSGFRCITFYSDGALRHVCMRKVIAFAQSNVWCPKVVRETLSRQCKKMRLTSLVFLFWRSEN